MQEYPHRIRLRGPWECEPLARHGGAGDLPAPRKITMPCRWKDGGLHDFAGVVRFRRRFGYPGRIDEYERVWLTLDAIAGEACITLNHHTLGRCGEKQCPCEFEVTNLLQPRNELVIDVESQTDEGGLYGEVALEIRRTAFLKNVQARWINGDRIKVAGDIVGTCDRPLDVYVLLGRKTIGYASIAVVGEKTRFEILSDPLEDRPAEAKFVRIELVDGGVVWYGVEVMINE